MKKIFLALGIIAALFAVALAGVGLYIAKKFPPEKVKALVEAKATEALGRKLTIGEAKGSFAFGFLPNGIALENLVIAEREGWGSEPFLKIEKLEIGYQLLPLLLFQLELEARIINPEIRLLTRKGRITRNGKKILVAVPSYSDIIKSLEDFSARDTDAASPADSASSSASAPGTEGGAINLPLADVVFTALEIRNASILMRDQTVKPFSDLLIPDLDLQITDLSVKGKRPTRIVLSCPIEMHDLVVPVELEGHAVVSLPKNVVRDIVLKGSVMGLDVSVTGSLSELTGNMKLAFEAALRGDIEDVVELMSDMPVELTGPMTSGHRVSGTLDNLKIRGDVDLSAVHLESPGTLAKKAGVPLTAKYTFDMLSDKWKFTFGGTFSKAVVTGAGRVTELERLYPLMAVALKTNKISLADMMALSPLAEGVAAGGSFSMGSSKNPFRLTMNMGRMETLKFRGSLGTQKISIGTPEFPKTLSMFSGNLALTEKTADGEFSFNLTQRPGKWTIHAKSSHWLEENMNKLALDINHKLVADTFDVEAFQSLFPPIVHLKDAAMMMWAAFRAQPVAGELGAQAGVPGGTGTRMADTLPPPRIVLPPSWKVRAENRLGQFKFRELAASNVTFNMSVARSKITIPTSGMNIAGGKVTATGSMDLNKASWDKVKTKAAFDLKGVIFEKFITDALKAARADKSDLWGQVLKGKADGHINVNFSGLDPDRVASSMTGNIGLSFARGSFILPKEVLDAAKKIKIGRLPTGALENLKFEGVIGNEKVTVKTLSSTGRDSKIIRGTGAIGFDTQYKNHLTLVWGIGPKNINTANLPPALQKIYQYGKNKDGTIPLDIKLTGSMSSPTVKDLANPMNLTRTAQKNAKKGLADAASAEAQRLLKEKLGNKLGDKVGGQVGEKVGSVIQGLFKSKSGNEDKDGDQDNQEPKKKEKLGDKLKKLGGLFK